MKSKPIFWVLSNVKPRIPALVLLTVVHIVQALLAVAFALGSRGVIDSAVGGDQEAFLRACLVQGAIIAGILMSQVLYRHEKDRLTAELDRDWKKKILHGLLHGEYEAVSAYHSGELINRLTNDVRVVDEGLVTALPNAASMIAKLIAAFAVLLALEPVFTLLIVLAGGIVILVTGLMRRRLKGLHKQVSAADGKVSGFIQEALEKLLMVQAMGVSGEMERRAGALLNERYEIQRKRKNVSLVANTGVSTLYYAAGFLALVWCSGGLLQGTMSFGSLTAIIQLVNQLQSPLVNLSGVIPKYIAMTAAAERLMDLDAISGEEAETEKPDDLYQSVEVFGAEGLAFSYDRDIILENTDFRLPKNAFAVVTGNSGIGKSTLLKLMLGIVKPTSGQLYVEGEGRRTLLDRSTRGLFAFVPQGNLLLSGTLRENLILTRPDASEEEIREAVYVSAMDEYLVQLPDGLETVLGENGAGLSEGQIQRLAIARAILSGAPVLLLDEITSALDVETERKVLERIRQLPNRTCIAVTHRPAALELADWKLEVAERKIHVEPLRK